MAESADTIKAKIREAFEDAPYPGDESLVADQSDYDPESRVIANAFKGKDWRDVSLEMLRNHADALPLFTPAAFRYYLPAYMIGCVDSYYDLNVAPGAVLFNLTPPKQRNEWEWDFFWVRAQQFNEHEKGVIKSFLALMDLYERADWASQGMEPPKDRVGPALEFWHRM